MHILCCVSISTISSTLTGLFKIVGKWSFDEIDPCFYISPLWMLELLAVAVVCFLKEIWKSFNSSSREKSASFWKLNSLLPFVLQRIKDEVERRKLQCMGSCDPGENKLIHRMPEGHEQFQKLLGLVRSEWQLNLPASPRATEQVNGQHKLLWGANTIQSHKAKQLCNFPFIL